MSKRLSYSAPLDGLRAVAALMVLFSHYLLEVGWSEFRYGWNGVQIFFVISGYLITLILLSQKNEVRLPKMKMVTNFIIKRALRLFPVYYLFLTVLVIISALTGLWLTKEGTLWYFYTYTQNWLFLNEGFQSALINHTWSLAVEEQFYLFWPLIIFFLPRRAELPVLITVFLGGIAAKYYFTNFYITPGTVKGVTFMHFDTLGAGALLAYAMYYQVEWVKNLFSRLAIPMAAIGLAVSLWLTLNGNEGSMFLSYALVLMSVSLVYLCSQPNAFSKAVFGWPILVRIGKISYGVYLYHKPVPYFVSAVLKKLGIFENIPSIALFLIYTGVALGISVLSWHLFEKYFLKLKEKFDV